MEEILNNLISYFSNIWIGIGIALFVSVLIVCLVMVLPNRKPTPITYLICIALLPFVAYQTSRIYGALTLKDYIDTLTTSASYVSDGIASFIGGSNIIDNELVGALSLFVPGVSEIQDFFSQLTTQGNVLIESVNDYINGYIMRRALWLCLFLLITVTVVFLSLNKKSGYKGRSRRTDRNRPESRRREHIRREHRS